MSDDRYPILKHSFRPQIAKWGVALGFAVVAGLVLGLTITTFPQPDARVWIDREMVLSIDGYPRVIAAGWLLGAIEAVAAGIVVGLACAVAVRARPLLVALMGGLFAAGSAAMAIVLWQWQRGRWPVGTIDGRMFVVAAALVVLACSAALLAAISTSWLHRHTA